MSDLGDMERRIKEIFDRAGRELKAKWADWMKDMDAELAGLQKEYEAAKASGDAAVTRKAGIALSRAKKTKIMGNKYYDKMVKQAAARLNEANEQAMAYINGRMPKVYASSFNGSTQQIVNGLPYDMGVSFDLVDESTVARLMRDPALDLHDLQGGINGRKMAAWNNRAISSEILQGIVEGDSIPRIAGRLMNVAGMDQKAATRTARTMTTGAENAGREDSYLRAQDIGIALHQKWIAAIDGRTRHSHRQLDGEVQEVGKRFSNGLRFPGDPEGPPAEICNCRCTLIAVLDGFDRDQVERWNKLEGQSYEEWKTGGFSSDKKKSDSAEQRSIVTEITDAFAVRNTPGIGFITRENGEKQRVKQHEIDTAEKLVEQYGGDIMLIDNSGNESKRDYQWLNTEWELKKVTSITSADNQAREAVKQIKETGGNLIIDCYSDDIESIIDKVIERLGRSNSPSMDIIVLNRGQAYKVIHYEPNKKQ